MKDIEDKKDKEMKEKEKNIKKEMKEKEDLRAKIYMLKLSNANTEIFHLQGRLYARGAIEHVESNYRRTGRRSKSHHC